MKLVRRILGQPAFMLVISLVLLPIRPAVAAETCFGQPATISGAGLIIGTSGNDVIVGSSGSDLIDGRGGNDLICGRGGADTLLGGPGDGFNVFTALRAWLTPHDAVVPEQELSERPG